MSVNGFYTNSNTISIRVETGQRENVIFNAFSKAGALSC